MKIYSRVMSIRQRVRAAMQLAQICEWQSLLLQTKDAQIQVKDAQISRLKESELRYQRHYLDLAIAFRRALDEDDPDLSEKLEDIICDVSDLVARLEEHSV